MEDDRGRWRTRFIIFSTAAFVVFLLWVSSTPFSFLGLLAISFPILALIYMASVSASKAYPHAKPLSGAPTIWESVTRVLPGALVVAGFAWLAGAAGIFIVAGDLKFGVFGLSIAVVFLVTAFPSRLTMTRIGVICAGLIVASILFVI